MIYRLFVPPQAVGASLVYFDLFNASGSTSRIQLLSVAPTVQGSAAVTGVLGVDLYLTRTTAVGTGGTAATNNGTSLTAATFTSVDHSQVLSPSITARLTPSAGAAAGAVISYRSVFTEETSGGAYSPALDMVTSNNPTSLIGVVIPEGSGIRVVQGSVASVGNIGFDVMFALFPVPF